METNITSDHLDRHVDSRLRNRTRIYFVISGILAIVVVYRLFAEAGDPLLPIVLFAAGLAGGIVFSRMYKISWDHDAQKIVSRLDIYGGVILALYIVFEIFSRRYLEAHFSGPQALTLVFSLLSGVIIGRGIGMLRTMIRVIRTNI